MDSLDDKLAKLKKQLIPESDAPKPEPVIPPTEEFGKALKNKIQAIRDSGGVLGDSDYEARKKRALQQKKEEDSKPKTVKRRNIWGEEI